MIQYRLHSEFKEVDWSVKFQRWHLWSDLSKPTFLKVSFPAPACGRARSHPATSPAATSLQNRILKICHLSFSKNRLDFSFAHSSMLVIILFYSLQFLLNSFDFLSSLCLWASAGYIVHIARFGIFGVELVLSAKRRTRRASWNGELENWPSVLRTRSMWTAGSGMLVGWAGACALCALQCFFPSKKKNTFGANAPKKHICARILSKVFPV